MMLFQARRRKGRDGCRPRLEALEARTMMSGPTTDSIIQASATRAAYHVDGTGLAAAMIDTGVDYTHQAFGPTPTNNFGPGHTVEDGYDFTTNTPDPYSTNSHGTATAGIVASVSPLDPGVAPGANIVALKVIGSDGSGSFQNVVNALQYVVNNHVKDHISVVNISLSDGGDYPYDFFSNDNGTGQEMAGLINQLSAMDIPVVAATGNSFLTAGQAQGMGLPAILSDVISVTATDPNDVLLPDAERLGAGKVNTSTTLAAPGQNIIAPTADDEFTPNTGTSYAAPLVTGGIILLQNIYEQHEGGALPSVANVTKWLQEGAAQIHDATTGISLGRLDILASAQDMLKDITPATPQTQVYVNGSLNATIPSSSVADPLAGFTDASGNAVNFSQVFVWTSSGATSTLQASPSTTQSSSGGSSYSTIDVFTAPKVAASSLKLTTTTPPASALPAQAQASKPVVSSPPVVSLTAKTTNAALLAAMKAANAAAIAKMSK